MARNLDPKAREARLEAIRRQNAADAKRARTLQVVAVVIVVVLVAAVVVAIVLSSRGGDGDGEAAGALVRPDGTVLTVADDPDSGAFLVGEPGEVELVVFEDFQCPACAAFEAEAGPLLAELAAGEDVSVLKRPISILDPPGEAGYSTRSAAAAACVGGTGDGEAYDAFTAALFAEQPDRGSGGLDDTRLVELATAAGADVGDCITEGTYRPWATATTEQAAEQLERLSTPTVLLDGEVLTGAEGGYPSPAELQAAVDAALGSEG